MSPSFKNSGRVSVFAETNNVDFYSIDVSPDAEFVKAIRELRRKFSFKEIHLTGGEPTRHPQIVEIVRVLANLGLEVKITSNGETGSRYIGELKNAGLKSINHSIFGTTERSIKRIMGKPFQDNPVLAKLRLKKLWESLDACQQLGLPIKANLVISSEKDYGRAYEIINKFSPTKLKLRILNDLDNGEESIVAVYKFLSQLNAKPKYRMLTAGASGAFTVFELPDGQEIRFKQIRAARLNSICKNCKYKCLEGYYGLRMYRTNRKEYKIGVCIQRMEFCQEYHQFLNSSIADEIIELREYEYKKMKEIFG